MDTTNRIDLEVRETGVADAAKVIVVLADGSDRAGASVRGLRAELDALKGSGLSVMAREFNQVVTASQQLRKETEQGVTAQTNNARSTRESASAMKVESDSIKGLIGTKAELREINRTLAADNKAVSDLAKQNAAAEKSARDALISSVLREREAQEALSLSKQKQNAATAIAIREELELARATELATLKQDIVARNPPVKPPTAKDERAAMEIAANAELEASNAALIAQYAALTEVETAAIAPMGSLVDEQTALDAMYASVAQSLTTMTEAEVAETDSVNMLSAAYYQLAEATSELNAVKAGYKEIQAAIVSGDLTEAEGLEFTASAMQANAEATEQVRLAKANLIEVQDFLNGALGAEVVMNEAATASTSALTTAYRGQIAGLAELTALKTAETVANGTATGSTLMYASALSLLEGRMMGVTRAAGRMLATMLGGIGAIVGMVVGVVALVAILGVAIGKYEEFETKIALLPQTVAREWNAATDEVIGANIKTEAEIDKLTDKLDKLQGHPGRNGLVIQFDMASEAADNLGKHIDSDIAKMDELLKKNQTTAWQRFGGAGDATDVVGAVMGDNRKIQDIKDQYKDVFQQIRDDDSLTAVEKTKQIDDNTQRMLGRLQMAYSAGDQYLRNLSKQARQGLDAIDNGLGRATGAQYSGSLVGQNRSVADLKAQLAAAQQALELRQRDQEGIGADYAKSQLERKVETATNDKAQHKDDGKLAREQWQQALNAFKAYRDEIIKSGKNPTSVQEDAWWQHPQNAQGQALKFNLGAVDPNSGKSQNTQNKENEEGKYAAETNSLKAWAQEQVTALDEATKAQVTYGDVQKEGTVVAKFLKEAQAKNMDPSLIAAYLPKMEELSAVYASQMAYSKALHADAANRVDDEAAYTKAMNAQAEVLRREPALANTAQMAMNKLTEEHLKATVPMYAEIKAYGDQMQMLGLTNKQREIENQLLTIRNRDIAAGVVGAKEMAGAYKQQMEAERERLQVLQRAKELDDYKQQFSKQGYNERKQSSNDRIGANNEAVAGGTRNSDQRDAMNLQEQVAQANDQLINNQVKGWGTVKDVMLGAVGEMGIKFTSFAQSAKQIMGDVFKKMEDGIASSLSHWIAYGGNIGKVMKDLGREIIQDILQSLIKVAIESIIVKTGLKAAMAGMFAASGGYIGFGGLRAQAFASGGIVGYDGGGHVSGAGTGTSDSILAWLSNGEYVMNAATTAMIGKDNLDAIQKQSKSVGSNSPGIGGRGLQGGRGPKMTIEDHTSGVKWQTVQVGENEMRVIARDEGKKAVYKHGDDATSQAMTDPNSKSRKALHQNTTARPNR